MILIDWWGGCDWSFRFSQDIEYMTGIYPGMYWQVCWRFVGPVMLIGLLIGSFIDKIQNSPEYDAWNSLTVSMGEVPTSFHSFISIVHCWLTTLDSWLGLVGRNWKEGISGMDNDTRPLHGPNQHCPHHHHCNYALFQHSSTERAGPEYFDNDETNWYDGLDPPNDGRLWGELWAEGAALVPAVSAMMFLS